MPINQTEKFMCELGSWDAVCLGSRDLGPWAVITELRLKTGWVGVRRLLCQPGTLWQGLREPQSMLQVLRKFALERGFCRGLACYPDQKCCSPTVSRSCVRQCLT